MIHRRILVLGLALAAATQLIAMESPRERAIRLTEQNETQYNQIDCRPFITLTVMQTAPRFYTLIDYVKQLTPVHDSATGEYKMKTDMGWYKRIDPDKWHMSLITIALPFSDRLMQLYKATDEKSQRMLVAETRKYAQKALEDLAGTVAIYAKFFKGLEFSYNSSRGWGGVEGIGTNKFIAANFDFENAAHRAAYERTYANIINDFLVSYPTAWMRYGFEFMPHVSVMEKSYAPAEKISVQGAACKGSGRGMPKLQVAEKPKTPVVENLILFHNERPIIVSARAKGYPVAETNPKAKDFYRKGELIVKEDGTTAQWSWAA